VDVRVAVGEHVAVPVMVSVNVAAGVRVKVFVTEETGAGPVEFLPHPGTKTAHKKTEKAITANVFFILLPPYFLWIISDNSCDGNYRLFRHQQIPVRY
jgi:hypothetical protein